MASGGKRKGAGRPKGAIGKVGAEVRELAQQYTRDALRVLAEIMLDPDAQNAARVSAANSLLDRAHGKPTQTVTGDRTRPVVFDLGSLFGGDD